MAFATVNLHEPDKASTHSVDGTHWLRLYRDYESAAIFTTAERAAAMAFAFNNPAAVLALISDDPVTIVEDEAAA